MRRIWKTCGGALWLALYLLSSSPAASQVLVSVRGNVSDPSGGAIQNAAVHLTNIATNADHTATTDQRGSYTFPDVAPGTYRLRIEAPGFEAYEQSDIRLQANAPATIDVKLKVSQVQQSVRVTAQAGDQCIAAKGRILPEVGPGLRAIRSGPSGNYYVLTAPGASAAIYSPDGKRIGRVPLAPSSAPSPGSSPGSSIVSGSDLQVDSDGRVFVADFAANAIKIYSEDGTLARAIRVPSPVSVEPLPGGEVAVASLSSKHLVDVYDQERGELFRSFGDAAPVVVQCDSSTLICTEPTKDAKPAATTAGNRVWFYGDSAGNVYVSLMDSPNPTIRKYDAYGYVAYESAFSLSRLSNAASASGNSGWSANPDVRVSNLGTVDLSGQNAQTYNTANSQGNGTSNSNGQPLPGGGPGGGMRTDGEGGGLRGGGGGAGGRGGEGITQFGVRLTEKAAGPLSSRPAIEAIGVDPASQEIWASIGATLVHFDKDGQFAGSYCLSTTGQPALKPTTILVEPNRILVGNDPFGIFEYARPDK